MMHKTKKLVIVGDSSFAEVAYEYFTYDSEYEVVAFSVEVAYLEKSTLFGLPIIPFEELEQLYPHTEVEVFVAIVYTQLNRLRTRLYLAAKKRGYTLASYISKQAFLWRNVQLGEHCFIFEQNVLQPFVSIGSNVILWSGNHIGHHTVIGDNCFIASHVVISGHCKIGENCFFGVNVTLGDQIKIPNDTLLGAGALIVRSIKKEGGLYKSQVSQLAEKTSYEVFKVNDLLWRWKKRGVIFVPDGLSSWALTHAMVPTPFLLDNNLLRIYITCCDAKGIGRPGYIDVDLNEPQKIIGIGTKPLLEIGLPGTFDENGILATSIVQVTSQKKYLYYVGFELGTKIRYRLLSGLAISDNKGDSFIRHSPVPILERSAQELYFRGGPFVLLDNGIFKMWYVAGSEWIYIANQMKPSYTINYMESADGIHWPTAGQVCIQAQDNSEYAFGRPYVLKQNGLYKMFYSIRKNELSYRLGYAESLDGVHWMRKDKEMGIDVSKEGWDHEMICYSAVFVHQDKTYLFYNGNGFGKTGVGFAQLMHD